MTTTLGCPAEPHDFRRPAVGNTLEADIDPYDVHYVVLTCPDEKNCGFGTRVTREWAAASGVDVENLPAR